MAEIYRVRASWKDAKSQRGAFSVLSNAKKCADASGLKVFNSKGACIYPLYYVRKTWADKTSQKGAFSVLANAKTECNKYVGYHVYDEKGKSVHTSTKKAAPVQTDADIVKPLFSACDTEADWSYKSTYKWQAKPTVAKSKTNGTCVTYVACCLQRIGVLKSGEYVWHNGKGYGTGKVYGNNALMDVIYTNNKKPSAIKSLLKPGDILMHDDNKSGVAGDGGHVDIFKGTINSSGKALCYSGGCGSGHNTSKNYADGRTILAIVRIKRFKVTTSVTGGSITETKSYLAMQDPTITYKASSGKKLKSVTIDGKAIDIKKYPTSYQFKDITKDHTVKVVFE